MHGPAYDPARNAARPQMSDDFEITLRDRGDDTVRIRGREGGPSGPPGPEVQLHCPALLWGGRRFEVPTDGLLIGREARCDLQLVSGLVAPVHARIEVTERRVRITDLGSNTGVYVNGEHFRDDSRTLRGGDSVAIGDEVLYFVTTEDPPLPPVEVPRPHSKLEMDRPQLRLGRDVSNDIVLDHAQVSPFHAEIVVGESGARIKNTSRGGTGLRVNGRLVSRTFLKTGDEIAIGPFRLVFDGRLLQQRAVAGGMRLDAEAVSFAVGDKQILQPTSLTLLPGELVAVIGPSGAGKSTLLKSLCGVYSSTGGRVTVDGEPVRGRLADLGYVPQDEIVHPLLTVEEALAFAADLRLPLDVRPEDKQAAVARVLDEVGLASRARVRIADLSGGQRKRAGVASELISQPGMLFLDEPTTGLDPGLEQRLMKLFRDLAQAGRATLVVTHATRSLRLCDKVVVMGEGGYLCFDGPPAAALEFFGVAHFDDLYSALEGDAATSWADRFRASAANAPAVPAPAAPGRRLAPPRPLGPHVQTLVRRRMRILSRDTRNLWILGAQVPIIAVLLALLFHKDVFQHGVAMTAGLSAQLLFLLVTVALWFGSLASAREIVKERAVMQRETAVGVRIPAYLLSKAIVLGALTGAQTVTLAAIVIMLRPLHESESTVVLLVVILVLTSWAGVGMGLLVSASVGSEDQAASFVPLLLIPQLLFGGSVMPVHQMGFVLKVLSKTIVAQWAFAGVGSAIHMNTRIADDPPFAAVSRFGHSFFGLSVALPVGVIALFIASAGVIVSRRLSRDRRA
jgi:ABC-type multidrug transport system ATPase subunit/pSer/pThr/pTyr-binding forkhead associated (FHA) protein